MCHNLRGGGRGPPATAFTTPACCSVNTGSQARYRLRISISAYTTCIRRPRSGGGGVPIGISSSRFDVQKLEWWKKIRRYLCSFWQNVRTWQTHARMDKQTDTQTLSDGVTDTAWWHRPRLPSSRGKNSQNVAYRRELSKNVRNVIFFPGTKNLWKFAGWYSSVLYVDFSTFGDYNLTFRGFQVGRGTKWLFEQFVFDVASVIAPCVATPFISGHGLLRLCRRRIRCDKLSRSGVSIQQWSTVVENRELFIHTCIWRRRIF